MHLLFFIIIYFLFIPLKAKTPPVANPATIGLIKSSFYLKWISEQSIRENIPPHIPKEP